MSAIATRSDVDIQEDVLRELRWDSRFQEDKTKVGVSVHNGIVTLQGTVDTFGRKWAAADAAHRVKGVLDVANDLAVKAWPSSTHKTDTEIAAAVRHALEWDVFIPDRQIRSTVDDGWVSLEGEVDYVREREDAAEAVKNLTGVRGLTNTIRVRRKSVQPSEVRAKIKDALERRADRDADRIGVDISDGNVTLTGRVHTWGEKQAVYGTVAHAAGVTHVDDKLRIEPFF